MTIKEANEILKRHNAWRRGADVPMESPKQLSKAIGMITDFVDGRIN